MIRVKYLIIGAGPSGLAFANTLKKFKEDSFLVLEKENEVGGLCRSQLVDDSPLDIGGGHFLDSRNEVAKEFLFSFLSADSWAEYQRKSDIFTDHYHLDYPYESNIWQLSEDAQIQHLISIAKAGSTVGKTMPKKFSNWIRWKLGDTIAEEYMLPYNRKIFGANLDSLGTYWLYKLPNVSLAEVFSSCINRAPQGKIPAHGQFLYPKKFGYGEVFSRAAQNLDNKIFKEYEITQFDFESHQINREIEAEFIIMTAPWPNIQRRANFPTIINKQIQKLKATAVQISYHSDSMDTHAHWSYYSKSSVAYHRVLHRQNFLLGARGHWTESNPAVYYKSGPNTFTNAYAYPLNRIDKPAAIKQILDWSEDNKIIGLGRWGEWEHMNSDIAISKAIQLATEMVYK